MRAAWGRGRKNVQDRLCDNQTVDAAAWAPHIEDLEDWLAFREERTSYSLHPASHGDRVCLRVVQLVILGRCMDLTRGCMGRTLII